jgi:hypothetical protein
MTKQEPIAWMRRLNGRIIRITPEKVWDDDEPLYTEYQDLMPTIVKDEQGKVVAITLTNEEHQVQEVLWEAPRELSDEEILNVAFCCEVNTVAIENDWDGTVIDFAKAILKKASER